MRKLYRLIFLTYTLFLFVAWQVTETNATFTTTSTHYGFIQADEETYVEPLREDNENEKKDDRSESIEHDDSLAGESNDDETDETKKEIDEQSSLEEADEKAPKSEKETNESDD